MEQKETLEEIVARHPLPWYWNGSHYDRLASDAPAGDVPEFVGESALPDAAPAMALAIRALLIKADDAWDVGEIQPALKALRASLPEEFRL